MSNHHQTCENDYGFRLELRRRPDLTSPPLFSEDVTGTLGGLVDEAFSRGVLADVIPEQADSVEVRIEPQFETSPVVSAINVHLRATVGGASTEYTREFRNGGWGRLATLHATRLRKEEVLAEDEDVYQMLVALPDRNAEPDVPPLQAPPIVDGNLSDFGIRGLGSGDLVRDRPVLVNQRMVDDAINACLTAGASETGGATLGALVRLREPLPETSTRIVTVLTTCVEDNRHTGEVNQWHISPEALAETARIADMRGMNESVVTVTHTHGFNASCGNCNTNAACPLAECTDVSLLDYQVLETLFPGKATVMPIAGRKMGAPGNKPVLEIHAWRGGQLRPIRWQTYRD